MSDNAELLGLSFARCTCNEVVEHVFGRLAVGRGGWLVTTNVDHLRRYTRHEVLRKLVATADLIVADGAPIVWAARLQGTPLPERVAGSDLVWLLAERAAQDGRRLYLLGGAPAAAQRAGDVFASRWPSLRIVGSESPWISEDPTDEEIEGIAARLVRAEPDLVYVALGSPKQEKLIAALRTDLPRAWWIGVGISLSFIAGDVRRAPQWMRGLGLEWTHRLAQEPVRLARRYLIEDLPFAIRLLTEAWRNRR